MAVAPWIVSDELWELVEPLLPVKERRFRYPGRKRLPDRLALQGILFVLHASVACDADLRARGLGIACGAGRGAAGCARGSSCFRVCPSEMTGRTA